MRTPSHEIAPLFVNRWSPRSMNGAPVEKEQLNRLFEAARWAPSGGNAQPWRFVYAVAGTPAFDPFLEIANASNQEWCKRAGALIVVVSREVESFGPNRSHSFDAGAAWMSLALQGSLLGLHVHAMGGIDYDKARATIHAPSDHAIECLIAVGYPGHTEDLPERLRPREQPSPRKSIEELVFEGRF